MRLSTRAIAVAVAYAAATAGPAPMLGAQSLLDHPDNISGDWVGNSGTFYFNFVHRFSTSPLPEKKVTNFPTFLMAAGIASRGLIGANYASNSALTPRFPNEWELFGRYAALQQEEGAPIDLGGEVDYNFSVKGAGGNVSIARREGPLRILAVARVLADTLHGDKTRYSFGGGGTLRFGRFVAIAGDATTITSPPAGERVTWSAGMHFALPNTPHTLSLNVSNAPTATSQGLARGTSTRRFGFEFTIPITLDRYTHNAAPSDSVPILITARQPAAADSVAAPPVANARVVTADTTPPARAVAADTAAKAVAAPPRQVAQDTAAARPTAAVQPAPRAPAAAPKQNVNARIKGLKYIPGQITVTPGSTVHWKNLDAMQHTVTATDKTFDSSLIDADGTYSHTFAKPGSYAFFCTLHPFMKGTVVVK